MKKTKYITLTLALSVILVACNNEKAEETNIETTKEQTVIEVKDETSAETTDETTKETQEETKAEEIEESVAEKVEEELEKEVKKIEQKNLSKEEKEKQIEKAKEKVVEKVAKEEKVDKKKVEKIAKAEVKKSVKKAESKKEAKTTTSNKTSKTSSTKKTTTASKPKATTSNKTTSKPKTTTTNKTTVKKPVVVVERYTDTDPIHYQTIDKYKGKGTKSKVVQKGKDGSITKVRNVTFTDDVKTDEELVDTIIVEPVSEIIARYVKVQDEKWETKEVEDKTKPVYLEVGKERWFVRNQETGEFKYFYSAADANEYHGVLTEQGILSNWGTAPTELIKTDTILGYDYKTVEVKVQDEKWEWKY